MKVTEVIKNQKKTQFSFEILPPLKGQNINDIFSNIEPLLEFKPPFIDVTYHREEYKFENQKDGTIKKVVIRKRPGTVGVCAAIMNKYGIDAVPHILAGGFTKQEIENILIDFNYLGIVNILALRGDAIKNDDKFKAKKGGYKYANQLVDQINKLNNGIYIDDTIIEPYKTDFCIGVAAYPEKHCEAKSMEDDIKNLKRKVDAGANYIVTQIFFDNSKFFEFVENCKKAGINVPIIPGLKPIATKNHLELLPKFFSINIPEELKSEVNKCSDNKKVNEVGIKWAIAQSKELIKSGTPIIHFYSMGRAENIQAIAKNIF